MYFLACDIGASSGRHILAHKTPDGKIALQEIYRFENESKMKNDHYCWDIDALFGHVLQGLKEAKPYAPASFSVDTWGVDFVLLDEKDELIGDAVAYRDSRTQGMDAILEKKLPFEKHYAFTGIAKQPFNTVYQLMAVDKKDIERARTFLLLPNYLHFLLTNKKCNEYSIASTTGLLNARARDWDKDILNAAGIPEALFTNRPTMPGTMLGSFKKEIEAEIGYPCEVVLSCAHDTGDAFMAVPAKDENAVFLSSGTWSLLGIELDEPLTNEASLTAGFTNEGGYNGRIRYLKNIMGLWILQSVRKEQGKKHSFSEMADMAQQNEGFNICFDANAPRFLAPANMIEEINAALTEAGKPLPKTDGELYACIYHSLAACYQEAVKQLEQLFSKRYTSMNIVGGGSQSKPLNQWTANALNIPIYAGPAEGTALGNIIAQMIAAKIFPDLAAARAAIPQSFDVETYLPK